MGISIKGLNILPLIEKNSGSIEITKTLIRELTKRKRLTQSFLHLLKKSLLKKEVFMIETDRDSIIFTKPNKTYSNLINYQFDLEKAIQQSLANEFECRTVDVKLYQSLSCVYELIEELEEYPNTVEIEGEIFKTFDLSDCIQQLEEVEQILEGLTEVHEKHLKPSEFRDQFEEYFDDINHDHFFNLIKVEDIESADDFAEKDDLLYILDELRKHLAEALEQYQLAYL